MGLLETFLFEPVIAGGWARDSYYGVEAKDLDICIINFHPWDMAELVIYNGFLTALETKGYNISIYDQSLYMREEHHQVHSIVKFDDLDIDLIFYFDVTGSSFACADEPEEGDRVCDVPTLFTQFDCNLNHFYWNKTNGEVKPSSTTTNYCKLEWNRDINDIDRVEKMEEKALSFGWKVDDRPESLCKGKVPLPG